MQTSREDPTTQHPRPEQPDQDREHPEPGPAIINTASDQTHKPSPELLAHVFLASQESSYVTGATIAVTGGTPLA